MAPIFRFPRPRSFLHIVSLQTATEFINFTLLINKVAGFYGILALFTGYQLNPLQLSHYIYSIAVLILVIWLAPSISNPHAPLKNLAIAWTYVLDTAINAVYITLFSAGWFLLLAEHLNDPAVPIQAGDTVMGKGTMADTAGFTDPAFNASHVEVVADPAPGLMSGQKATAYAYQAATAAPGPGAFGHAFSQSDSLTSVVLIGLLILIRIYCCIIVMAHARAMLRQYIAMTSVGAANAAGYSDAGAGADPTLADSPFRAGREKGVGWQGTLGRLMVRFPGPRYWLGREDAWERATNARFDAAGSGARSVLNIKVPESGVGERERRARSGTGPSVMTLSSGKQAPE